MRVRNATPLTGFFAKVFHFSDLAITLNCQVFHIIVCNNESMKGGIAPNGELDLTTLSGDQLLVALYMQINQLNGRMSSIESKLDKSATADQLHQLSSRIDELSDSFNAINDRVEELERQRRAVDDGFLGRLRHRLGDYAVTVFIVAVVVVAVGGLWSFVQNRQQIHDLQSEVRQMEDLLP